MKKPTTPRFISTIFVRSQGMKDLMFKALTRTRKKIVTNDFGHQSWIKTTYAEELGMHGNRMDRFLECCTKVCVNSYKRELHWANYCENHHFCLACAGARAYNNANSVISSIPNEMLEKKYWYMLTFTISHTRLQDVSWVLRIIHNAKEQMMTKVSNCRNNKKMKTMSFFSKFEGFVRSMEVTKGNNGYHPHYHMIACSDEPIDVRRVCFPQGGYIVSNADALKEREEYVKKAVFNVADEILSGPEKTAKKRGMGFVYNKNNGTEVMSRDEVVVYMNRHMIDTFRGVHIKMISTDNMKNKPYTRKALLEVFKYAGKMAIGKELKKKPEVAEKKDKKKMTSLRPNELLEFTVAVKALGYDLFGRTGCFFGNRKSKVKKKVPKLLKPLYKAMEYSKEGKFIQSKTRKPRID